MIGRHTEFYDLSDGEQKCFLCESPDYTMLYRVAQYSFDFNFMQCRCGMIKQVPMPNSKFFEWFFNAELFFESEKAKDQHIWGYQNYFSDEPSRLATSNLRYRRLHRVMDVGRPLEILKIGPGTGTFLHIANRHGHHAIGCDISQRFLEYAQKTYKVHVDHGRFEDMPYAPGQFDVVIAFNVLENVPNQTEFLSAVHRAIKPNGHFIFNFVNMRNNIIAALQKSRYFLFRPPVCYAFTRPVMLKVLKKFHFVHEDTLSDVRYMTPEKILTLLGWKGIWQIFKMLRLHRVTFPIYAYPSQIIIARKETISAE